LSKVIQRGDSVTFAVKVHPRAKRERISGTVGDALKLELTAPPIDGEANDACVKFLSDFLKVPRSSVTIAAGANSRNKVIRVSGVHANSVELRIAEALKT
jgi:uncharacterized protein (TIGR00251 family)